MFFQKCKDTIFQTAGADKFPFELFFIYAEILLKKQKIISFFLKKLKKILLNFRFYEIKYGILQAKP